MSVFDDRISDYVLGLLSPAERQAIRRAMTVDPELAARVARAEDTISELQALGRSILEEPVPPRLLALLDPQGGEAADGRRCGNRSA